MRLLCFTIDGRRFGIAADVVIEIVRAVAITPLPGVPVVIEGVIDVRGVIVPVFDLRNRFELPPRRLEPSHRFILVRTLSRLAALHVDDVLDLVDVADHSTSDLQQAVPGVRHIAGVATLPDGLVLIHDVETFLSHAESEALDSVLAARSGTAAAR